MRRFLTWAALVALGLLMSAPNAWATPTVTGHTGYIDSTYLAIAGAGFTTGSPTIAYMWNFESQNPADMKIRRPALVHNRKYPESVFGTATTNRFWHDLYDSAGTGYANFPIAVINSTAAKFGSYGLEMKASDYPAVGDTATALKAYFSSGSDAGESAYFSAWFKIVAQDTTMAGTGAADSSMKHFSLVRLVAQSARNNFDPVYVCTNVDSVKARIGEGSASVKARSWDLAKKKFSNLADGSWHRLDVYCRADADTTAASGKILIYYDYALCDSSNDIAWGRLPLAVTGWNAVQLCPVITEDRGRDLRVYWDDIYLAGGADFNYSGTPAYDALARVELQDKIVFGNATERYVQFPVSWANAAIVVKQTGDFAATDKVFLLPIPSGGDLLLQADTCLDSLLSAVPVLGSATLSSAATKYPAELGTFTWTDTSDNGLTGRDSQKSKTLIDWGDGTTTTLSSPGDTTSTHEYQASGSYTIKVIATNAAGTTTKTTSYTVNSQKVRTMTATGTIAIIPNNEGEDRITLDPVIGPTYVKLRHLNVGWDAAPWPVPAEGFTVSGDVDSVKVTALAGNDTLRVHVH